MATTSTPAPDPVLSYPRFIARMLRLAFSGAPRFFAAMSVLTAVALVGLNGWAHQLADGMIRTNMTDHVSWGLYIANFTFGVGLAAAYDSVTRMLLPTGTLIGMLLQLPFLTLVGVGPEWGPEDEGVIRYQVSA